MILHKKLLLIFLLVWGIFSILLADNPLEEFRKQTKSYYHHLEPSPFQNFSCLFTSGSYIDYIMSTGKDSSYAYPLKLIWTRSGKLYYILMPYPAMNQPEERQKVLEKIQLIKNQFHGFYLDWLNFLILSPVDDIPEDAVYFSRGDSVFITYSNTEEGESARVEKIFMRSGRLSKVTVITSEDKVMNYPKYKEVAGKWLCYGWDTRVSAGEEITSGIATRLELKKLNQFWFPVRADILVQTVEKPGEKFLSTLFMDGFEFDLPLQELPYTKEGADTTR